MNRIDIVSKNISKMLNYMYFFCVMMFFVTIGITFVKAYCFFIGIVITLIFLFFTITVEKVFSSLLEIIKDDLLKESDS